MNRSWLRVIGRLALTFGTVYGGFVLLLNPWRYLEADIVTSLLNVFGVDRVQGGYGNQILVMPAHDHAFLASISPSCSALAAVLGFLCACCAWGCAFLYVSFNFSRVTCV